MDITAEHAAAPALATAARRKPAASHERDLILLRSIIIVGELMAAGLAAGLLALDVPYQPVAVALLVQVALNVLAWRRAQQGEPMAPGELSAHLLADVLILTAILYYLGGTNNPFADLYFVPLAFGAATLPWKNGITIAATATAGHTLLGFLSDAVHVPSSGNAQDLWAVGIALSDLLTAFMIAFVVFRVAARLRHQQHLLTREREQALHNRRLVELGAMATGAAHELGSPLSTMAVLATELRRSYTHLPGLCDDLQIISTQIDACKETLSRMLTSTGQARAEGGGRLSVDQFLARLFDRWQRLRPGIACRVTRDGPQPGPLIVAELALEQAILNVLNNAADASPTGLDVHARWTDQSLTLRVDDDGAGVDPHNLAHVGRPFFSTKRAGGGKGLGLFLTATTIERLGGRFTLGPRPEGGARAEITLPLTQIVVAARTETPA